MFMVCGVMRFMCVGLLVMFSDVLVVVCLVWLVRLCMKKFRFVWLSEILLCRLSVVYVGSWYCGLLGEVLNVLKWLLV